MTRPVAARAIVIGWFVMVALTIVAPAPIGAAAAGAWLACFLIGLGMES